MKFAYSPFTNGIMVKLNDLVFRKFRYLDDYNRWTKDLFEDIVSLQDLTLPILDWCRLQKNWVKIRLQKNDGSFLQLKKLLKLCVFRFEMN